LKVSLIQKHSRISAIHLLVQYSICNQQGIKASG
jgi:hypothetical protein